MKPLPLLPDAEYAAALLSVDPFGLGGAVLCGRTGPQQDNWLKVLRYAQTQGTPWRRVPVHVDDDRLLGGLDVSASLSAGRPIVASGILAEADGGFVILPMAERLARGTAARISAVLDQGEVHVERDGISRRLPARFGLIALDEGLEEEESEHLSVDIADRLAFQIHTNQDELMDMAPGAHWCKRLPEARNLLGQVLPSDEDLNLLCGVAAALGVPSLRGVLLALRAARASAALDGRKEISQQDIELAVRLVLAPRARQFPDLEQAHQPPPPPEESDDSQQEPTPQDQQIPDELVLEAVKAALPPGMLARLQTLAKLRKAPGARGRLGPSYAGKTRGRPIGVRKAVPRAGQRLHIGATLKAAAPWQRLRKPATPARGSSHQPRLAIRPEDFHVTRCKSRSESTTIFLVDASGSAAAQRLAEAKGAIEILLAECYVRRDQVALIAFRGKEAEILLSPTRALARARRELAGLPGGGGTPLAAGIDTARELGQDLQRRGKQPIVVVMTDGRANISRDGSPGHEKANEEAISASHLLRANGWSSLLVDTSNRPRPRARELADAMGAHYLPLPQADAKTLSGAVSAVVGGGR